MGHRPTHRESENGSERKKATGPRHRREGEKEREKGRDETET